MSEWSLTQVFDVVGTTIPDRDMIVWGDVRRTFGDAWRGRRARRAPARAWARPAPRAEPSSRTGSAARIASRC